MFTFMIGSIKFLFYRLYVFYAKLEWVFEILWYNWVKGWYFFE